MGFPEELLTGIHEIDDEHKKLFDILERLQAIVAADENWSVVYFAMAELEQYARTHFAVEEALMRLHDYPSLDKHVAEHRGFSRRLAQLEQETVLKEVSLGVIEFIKEWLLGHIGGSDLEYVPHLRTAPVVRGLS